MKKLYEIIIIIILLAMVDIHFFKAHKNTKLLVAELGKKQDDGTLIVRVDGMEEILNSKEISQIRLHIDF